MDYTEYFKLTFVNNMHIHKDIMQNENANLIDYAMWNQLVISNTSDNPEVMHRAGDEGDYDRGERSDIKDAGHGSARNIGGVERLVEGMLYIVPESTSYAPWMENIGQIALYISSEKGWHFITPRQGMVLFVLDTRDTICYHQGEWISFGKSSMKS